MTSGGPFQPKLLCDSGILCPVPSMQWSAWWWYHVSSWWPEGRFRAEQNNCGSLRAGNRSSELVGLAGNSMEKGWVRNWGKQGERVELRRAVGWAPSHHPCSHLRQSPGISTLWKRLVAVSWGFPLEIWSETSYVTVVFCWSETSVFWSFP